MKLQRRHKIIFTICALLFLGATAALISFYQQPDDNLKIYFLDVGQGDAILIRTPSKQNILIDGGPDNSVLAKLGKYLPWFCRRLDLVILTHPHADHLYGLIEVLKRYDVKNILIPNMNYNSAAFASFKSIIENKKIPTSYAYRGQNISLGPNCFLKTLYPFTTEKITKYNNANEVSIVNQLDCENSKTLLTGDVDNASGKKIYESNFDLKSDILKVSHHGSSEGSTFDFLDRTGAGIAIISVATKNKFDHPHEETIKNLEKLATKILRTDQMGDIIFIIKNGRIYAEN